MKDWLFKCKVTGLRAMTFEGLIREMQREILELREELANFRDMF